jgi:hypothetical protein
MAGWGDNGGIVFSYELSFEFGGYGSGLSQKARYGLPRKGREIISLIDIFV